MTINPRTNKPHGRLDGGARFIACTAEAGMCIDPFCDHTTVVVLDVVAEPDVAGISAWTDAPSETVQAEVTDALDRAEYAEMRQMAAEHRRSVQRATKLQAAERAHDQLHNHAQLLSRQCDEQFNRVDELRWQLANEEAFLAELVTIAGRAERDTAKALAKVVRIHG